MPDEKLKSLLGVSEKDEVTYFNLQRLMNKHFIKNTSENLNESKDNVIVS
jgi:chromatin remodeling complex protein RSC6